MKLVEAAVLLAIAAFVIWALEHRDPTGVHTPPPYEQYLTLGADEDGESAP